MAKNEAKIRFTAETGEFNDQIKQSNAEMSKLRAEMKLNDEQMKTAGASVEGLQQKQKLLADQLATSQQKTEALSQKVEKAKEIYDENSIVVQKLQTQLLTAQIAEERLQRQIATCNDELEAQRAAANKVETATEQLNGEIQEQQKELNQLKDEYKEAVLKFGATSDEAKELAGKIDTLSGELKDNKSKMADAANAADDLDKSLDNASSNDGEGFTVFKGALSDLISEGIQFAIGKVNELVDYMFGLPEATREIRQDFATLTTAFDNMGYSTETATEIWKGLYGVFGEDDRAVETANNIAKIARNEEDLNKWVTITAGIWGTYQDSLPVEGLAEAANETAKVGQVTGVLADALNWTAVDMKVYEQALSSNERAMEEFVWSLEAGESAEEAFNQALALMYTEEERAAAVRDVLTGLYSDAAATYNETSGSMLDAKNATAETILTENNLAAAVEPVTTAYQNLKNEMLQGILPAIEGLSGAATSALNWMREHPTATQAIAAAVGVLAIGIGGLATAWGIYTVAQWAANSAMLASPITWIVLGIVAAIAALVAIIVVVVSKWDEIVVSAEKAWNSLMDMLSNVGSWINDNVIQPVVKFFKGLIQWVKDNWSTILTFLINPFAGLFKYFYDNNKEFKKFVDNAITHIKELPGKVLTWLSKTIENIKQWGSNLVAKGKDAAMKLLNAVVNTIKSIPDKIKTVGKNLAEGIWKGISNSLSWIKGKIKTWVGNVTDFIKKLFGIKSPSTVMRDEVGKQLAAGVAVGIDKNTSEVQKKAEEMSKKVLDAAQKRLDDYKVYNDLSLSEEVAYWDSVKQQVKEGTDARLQAEKKYLEAKKSLDDKLLNAEETLQTRLDEIAKKVTDRQKDILSSFNLFSGFDPEKSGLDASTELLLDLQAQVDTLERYDNTIKSLESKIGGTALFEHLQELGLGSLNELMYVNKMTDAELQTYIALFDKRSEMAGNLAKEELAEDVFAETQTAYEEFAKACGDVGIEVSGSIELMQVNATKSLDTFTASITNSIQTIKNSLKEFKENLELPSVSVSTNTTAGSFNVEWASTPIPMFASGGILTKPTLNIAGEAGPEAIIPIDKLQSYISGSIEKTMQVVNMQSLIYAIEDLANRAIELNINGHKFATATAGDADIVNGSRMQLSKRGLAR